MADRVYYELGLQYYLAAKGLSEISRHCCLVTGTLFHHAIEMFLKSRLCGVTSKAERKSLGHKLPKIWKRFKAEDADPALAAFDPVIERIHKFERIRYPEPVVEEGMILSIGRGFGDTKPVQMLEGPQYPEYFLDLDQVEKLVAVILPKLGFNLEAFKFRFTDDGRRAVERLLQLSG